MIFPPNSKVDERIERWVPDYPILFLFMLVFQILVVVNLITGTRDGAFAALLMSFIASCTYGLQQRLDKILARLPKDPLP